MEPSLPSVDVLLEESTSGIHAVLGDALVGVYVYGSYVSGGFDSDVSDLDLAVVTSIDADAIDLVGLGSVHQDLVDRHPEWSDRLEVVYIGRATLRGFRSSLGRLAVISPGEPFHLRDERVVEWLQNWYLVRETGRTLYGPPPAAVVPAVDRGEFVAATARYAIDISRRSLGESDPGSLAYSVLTMCRALMTVQTQAPCSKQAGADWTSKRLPERAWVIDAALSCRLSRGSVGFDDPETRAAAQQLIALLATEIEHKTAIAQ